MIQLINVNDDQKRVHAEQHLDILLLCRVWDYHAEDILESTVALEGNPTQNGGN